MGRKKKTVEVEEKAPVTYVREKTAKELAVEKLSTRGINATLESGVIMARVKDLEELQVYEQALKDIGYDASWGVRFDKGETNYEVGRPVEGSQSEGSEDND